MSNIPETGRTPRVTIRLVAIQILVFSLLLTLGGRLWYLQIRNGDEYQEKAAGNHVQQVVNPAPRGAILDARGVPLADNQTRLVVTASRTELMKMPDDGEAVLARLAEVLKMKPAEIQQRVRLCDSETPQPCWNGSPYQPIPVTDEATTEQALQIRERTEEFPGINAEPAAVRHYPAPYGANTSQVLGYLSPVTDEEIEKAKDTDSPFLSSDQIGRSGLERSYNKDLRGDAGVTRYEVDKLGRVMGRGESEQAEAGSSLITSLDSRVQAVAERELEKAMKEARKQHDDNTGRNYEADAGAVVVMESKTGRVVSMASNPEYDPNAWVGGISAKDYKRLTGAGSNFPLINRAIQGLSAPGSVFKVVSTAAALKAGHDFNDTFDCSPSYTIGGQEFKNYESKGYGSINLGRALEVSCDTVFYRLAHKEWLKDGGTKPKKDPADWFYKTARDFGLGEKTGIDVPNEVSGRIPGRQWKKDYWEANKDQWCKVKDAKTYAEKIAKENCVSGMKMRAGDSVNYSIGQGDTLVTPVQMATIYAAISNGGTLYDPTVGKAVVNAAGTKVDEIEPKAHGKLPIGKSELKEMDKALEGVATRGTAAWRFGGWPQDKIPMHAKTGTAEVAGKQTTSWFTTYTEDYTVVMTISQGGTGSGASGPAVRNIYNELYGVDEKGGIDEKRALLPKPESALPKVSSDGQVQAERDKAFLKRLKKDDGGSVSDPAEGDSPADTGGTGATGETGVPGQSVEPGAEGEPGAQTVADGQTAATDGAGGQGGGTGGDGASTAGTNAARTESRGRSGTPAQVDDGGAE
ncbi:penicillin-binding protein 2 [Streptomyces sp. N2-109]|uniref:Penicillin-binding protein 2 n=1 Tax=Streptomyces gossypii TaxID=2883101 RepID=A0ABT2JSI6_9ACTN|nr:penicillin-binding protein 2 [Streptomyces gossypii]MCT2590449.1 penicillin-binding protein 2 [Streptomyces gossypii]